MKPTIITVLILTAFLVTTNTFGPVIGETSFLGIAKVSPETAKEAGQIVMGAILMSICLLVLTVCKTNAQGWALIGGCIAGLSMAPIGAIREINQGLNTAIEHRDYKIYTKEEGVYELSVDNQQILLTSDLSEKLKTKFPCKQDNNNVSVKKK